MCTKYQRANDMMSLYTDCESEARNNTYCHVERLKIKFNITFLYG